MGLPQSHEGPDVTKYFGSKIYYEGELLKDQRYKHGTDLETVTVTLRNGDRITMWAYAIDVRACHDPVKELPERGFNKTDDYVVFHYTDKEGFDNITSSKEVWASLSPQIDSNFGFGVYSARKAPHQWRSKKEIFINNFFPSKKDWQQRKHLDFTEWPSSEALKFNKPELSDRELDELLNTPFGKAILEKWEPTRKCDFCVPIVCDYHSAQDVMRKDTFAGMMDNGKTRRAGYNKFEEKEPSWRDVWTVLKFEKTALQQQGRWELQMCNASDPSGLILEVFRRRRRRLAVDYANAAASCTERGKTIVDAASDGDLPAVRSLLREDPAAVHLRDSLGQTPLQCAARHGQAEAVRCLLAAKAKVDVKDRRSQTPLLLAAKNGHQEVVRLLLAARAALDIKNDNGRTSLDIAEEGGHCEIIQVLKNASR